MRESSGTRGSEATRAVSAALLTAFLTGAGMAAFPPASDVTQGPLTPALASSPVVLDLDPESWWMVAGNATQVTATWAGIPAGCTDTPLWYRWSTREGWSVGSLSVSNNSSVTFTANSVNTGSAKVELRAASVVRCGANETLDVRNASADVTVVVPPRLGPLEMAPDPVEAGATSNLTGTLFDGQPPYHLRIVWDDGNVSFANLSASGPFVFAHRFAAGNFTPTLTVVDSDGFVANGSSEEPLYASSGLAVAVRPAGAEAEVGLPMIFTEELLHPPSNFSQVIACNDAGDRPSAGVDRASADANFTCTFARPGVAPVEFEVIPVGDGLPAVTCELELPVASPLSLTLSERSSSAEVDSPSGLLVNVSGGVAPFRLSWSVVGNATASSSTFFNDGSVLVPFWPSETGVYSVSARVEDALGTEAANASPLLTAVASLAVVVSIATAEASNGTWTSVAGAVTQGGGPFDWFVVPGIVPTNGSNESGDLPTVAEFDWQGLIAAEGVAPVFVTVVDRDGGTWWTALSAPLVPSLRGLAELSPTTENGSPALRLTVAISGGLPPFLLWANSTRATPWTASVVADGDFAWVIPANGSGAVTEEILMLDRLGVRWSTTLVANLSASAPPPSGAPPKPTPLPSPAAAPATAWTTDLLGIVLLLAVTVGAGWLLRHRRTRRNSAERTTPDPVAVLREIIQPADGVDRATVELMAGEAGVAPSAVGAAIDRLVAEGTLSSERGNDGEEVLSWSRLDD